MEYMDNRSLQYYDDEYIRKEKYGKCPTCNKYNTHYSWCQSCNPKLLTEGWTSGNEKLDELIKSTQRKATKYHYSNHLQWIPYNDLTNIEKIGEGGFTTISKATWLNGYKSINYNNERTSEDMTVALKKLLYSLIISDEFFNEVSYFISINFLNTIYYYYYYN